MRKNTMATLSLATMATLLTLSGCTGNVSNNGLNDSSDNYNMDADAELNGTAQGVAGIAQQLQARDLTVSAAPGESTGEAVFPTATAYTLNINGQTVQAYEYPDEEAAMTDAASVSEDGGTVGSTQVSWVGTPHFYRKGNVILLYLGNNTAIMDPLEEIAGQPFAQREGGADAAMSEAASSSVSPAMGTGGTL